ncbi:MAG: isopentenyl-diphosphate Delta-isomerase [Armatimonadota bacterium]
MTTEELVVLCDDQDQPIGTAPKATVHTGDTPLHQAFSVFLFDRTGRFLTQQRASTKKTWPLIWANSCCGHPLPGESRECAVYRRLRHELGITSLLKLKEVAPTFRYRAELDGIVENEICPVWAGVVEQEPSPNPAEVEAIRWIDWSEFLHTCDTNPAAYAPWTIEEVAALRASDAFFHFHATLVGTRTLPVAPSD